MTTCLLVHVAKITNFEAVLMIFAALATNRTRVILRTPIVALYWYIGDFIIPREKGILFSVCLSVCPSGTLFRTDESLPRLICFFCCRFPCVLITNTLDDLFLAVQSN